MIKEEFLYQALRSDDKDAFIKEYLKSIYEKEIKVKHKINIFDFCGFKTTALTGVFYKNGYANASDAHIALRVKSEYKEELEGKIAKKNGQILDYTYPNVDALISKTKGIPVILNFDEIKKQYVFYKIEHNLYKETCAKLEIDHKEHFFDFECLQRLSMAVREYNMNVQLIGNKLYASNDAEEFCIIMEINKLDHECLSVN